MDPVLPRKMRATLEPFHSMVYFAPEAMDAWGRLFPYRSMGYFASRSAAMGAVGPSVVTATFYNFSPAAVARAVPAVWGHADPTTVLAERLTAVDTALARLLGPAPLASDEMVWAAATAEAAARACPVDGRALFAGHADLPWPDPPHLRLWHATTLLREFRGDGHIAALVDAGLSGIEAVVSFSAMGTEFEPAFYRRSRGWTDEEWGAAEARLTAGGWLEHGAPTDAGTARRESIEAATDRLSRAPWEAIGEDAADRLRAVVRPWSRQIVAAGGLSGSWAR